MKEKLVELIVSTPMPMCVGRQNGKRLLTAANIADFLIANEVTIQKWIPVSELPMDKNEWYLTCDHKGNRHTMFHFKHYDIPFGIDENHRAYFPVKWFMPLPEAPKGE
jgi:hypothetical protein